MPHEITAVSVQVLCTQGNNSTQALSTKLVFFVCNKRDGQQKKKEAKKRTDKE